MKRLTKTFRNGERHTLKPEVAPFYAKLSAYEDVEEKFGIDLTILSRASENGFYMINNGKIEFVKQGYLFNLRGHYIHLNCGYKKLDFELEDRPFSDVLPFERYGETWALTKEQLL